MKLKHTILKLTAITCCTILGCSDNNKKEQLFGLENSTFRMSQNSDSIGFSQITFKQLDNNIHLHEKSVIPGFDEEMDVYISQEMYLDSVRVYGKFQDQDIDCFSSFADRKISGYSIFPFNRVDGKMIIDTTLQKPFYERATSLFLLSLNLDFNKSEHSFSQYNSNNGKISSIVVYKKSDTMVSVPAGDYDCFNLQFTGGIATQNLFIDKVSKRIVKITFEETPWVYELLKD